MQEAESSAAPSQHVELRRAALHACAALRLSELLLQDASSAPDSDADEDLEARRLERIASSRAASCSTAKELPQQCSHAIQAWQARAAPGMAASSSPASYVVPCAARELYVMLVHTGHTQAAQDAYSIMQQLLQGDIPLPTAFDLATACSSRSMGSSGQPDMPTAADQRAKARALPAGGGSSLAAVLQRAEAHLHASFLFLSEGELVAVLRSIISNMPKQLCTCCCYQ